MKGSYSIPPNRSFGTQFPRSNLPVWVLKLLLPITIAVLSASCDSGTQINGVVFDANYAPQANAEVILQVGGKYSTVMTDDRGIFLIDLNQSPLKPEGILNVTKPGFRPYNRKFRTHEKVMGMIVFLERVSRGHSEPSPIQINPAEANLTADIPAANRVILTSGEWVPSVEQTENAVAAIDSFLKKQLRHQGYKACEIRKILAYARNYRVQFVGRVLNKRNVIWCNFFPADSGNPQDEFKYWRKTAVEVFDGGFWFWQIKYDPATGKCSNFISNGYA
jgi:hypothetical protein